MKISKAIFGGLTLILLSSANPAYIQARALGDPLTAKGYFNDNKIHYHVVKKGDSYSKIADFYWGDSKESTRIKDMNPEIKPNELKPGMKIRVQ
jgi:hypothetical protein